MVERAQHAGDLPDEGLRQYGAFGEFEQSAIHDLDDISRKL